ncbi:glycerophosphoryl diester phosphodiesterase [Psychromonas sp. KJ10-10]|uniref:glycerophosphoryl diester phosphodiesterase n=1 Tax=Psychromonas sp. KJ10-10 TaxID=3391823 RepID=UPI0039B3CBDC
MKLTAHRGVSSLAPENTLAAFKKTAEMGYQWIEIDVQLSLDRVPVVIHDQSVNRCTNGEGVVGEMSLANLQSLDAGSWFSEAFNKEHIPSLEETLLLANEHNLKVNIEIKLYPEDDIALLCERITTVIVFSQIDTTQLLFSSFSLQALKHMRRLLPQIPRGFLCEQIPQNCLDLLQEIDAYSVHCDYLFLNKQQISEFKQAGYQVFCYTINDPQKMSEYWDWGVDMIITDKPQTQVPTGKNC